ncbi:hypothetical protein [Geminocystis sp. GBBB08]|uniref:hypothetical protein n=1 Tax=Geminocystis sp. GBBB08 TaxID=2604140 RepID=UPI0027E377F8|nr:hypothetical protein [Geminocystis sp. GBBB08]MBL1210874.1 hypothetical protein [Geminocystis sp. GBBB08]
MKINTAEIFKPTIIASALVLVSSLTVGIASGIFSFYLGSTSLEGVTSPQENPTQKINNKDSNEIKTKKFSLMSEQNILIKVYDHIHKAREESKVKEKTKK